MSHLLTREDFKKEVFKRDKYMCAIVGCREPAVDAHHIFERKLFSDGGYYVDNGVSLCSKHHIDAEDGTIAVEDLLKLIGSDKKSLCDMLKIDFNKTYDKWGKIL